MILTSSPEFCWKLRLACMIFSPLLSFTATTKDVIFADEKWTKNSKLLKQKAVKKQKWQLLHSKLRKLLRHYSSLLIWFINSIVLVFHCLVCRLIFLSWIVMSPLTSMIVWLCQSVNDGGFIYLNEPATSWNVRYFYLYKLFIYFDFLFKIIKIINI